MTLSTVITWFFRLRLTTQLYPHVAFTQNCQLKCVTSPAQVWTADVAQEEPCPRRNAVPGSEDPITQGTRNLQIADTPEEQPDRADRPSVTIILADLLNSDFAINEGTFHVLNAAQIRTIFLEAQITASSFSGVKKRGGQETVAIIAGQKPQLGTYSWVIFSKIGDSQVIGMPLQASPTLPPIRQQPIPQGDPQDDSPLSNSQIRDIAITERDAQLLGDFRWASSMATPRSLVSRNAPAWAQSLEGVLTGHRSWATLCRYRCRLLLPEVPHKADTNNTGCSCGRRVKFTTFLEELLDSSALGNRAGQRKQCSRRPKNNVGKELAPRRPEDRSAKQ